LPLKAILDDRSLVMTLPRTVADVLADHVTLEIECVDRLFCNVYVLDRGRGAADRPRRSPGGGLVAALCRGESQRR
jgi:hypothetical protein